MRAKARLYASTGDLAYEHMLVKDKTKPLMVVIKDFGLEHHEYTGAFTVDGLKSFIEGNKAPLVYDMTAGNSEEILNSGKMIVMVAVNPTSAEVKETKYQVRKAARDWIKEHGDKELVFTYLDGSQWEYYISRVFGIGLPDLPRVVIMDPSKDVHYDVGVDKKSFAVDKEAILNAVDGVR
jgi:hypothetical protein